MFGTIEVETIYHPDWPLSTLIGKLLGSMLCSAKIVSYYWRGRVSMDTFLRVNYSSFWRCSMNKKKRRSSTKEFKEEAVQLLLSKGIHMLKPDEIWEWIPINLTDENASSKMVKVALGSTCQGTKADNPQDKRNSRQQTIAATLSRYHRNYWKGNLKSQSQMRLIALTLYILDYWRMALKKAAFKIVIFARPYPWLIGVMSVYLMATSENSFFIQSQRYTQNIILR